MSHAHFEQPGTPLPSAERCWARRVVLRECFIESVASTLVRGCDSGERCVPCSWSRYPDGLRVRKAGAKLGLRLPSHWATHGSARPRRDSQRSRDEPPAQSRLSGDLERATTSGRCAGARAQLAGFGAALPSEGPSPFHVNATLRLHAARARGRERLAHRDAAPGDDLDDEYKRH